MLLTISVSIGILLVLLFVHPNQIALAEDNRTNNNSFIYDKKGVPWYNYTHAGPQRNPLFIANEVIYHSTTYQNNGDKSSKDLAINNANWLVNNAVLRGNYSVLEFKFNLPKYDLESPWVSATANARAAQALTRAHALTGNQTYLDTAKSLLNAFFVEVKDGGVTYKTPNDGWWYEGFTDNAADASKPLDGMISSLLSLHAFYKYAGDTDAKFLFDQGITSLKKNLSLYDNDGYSYYDIQRKPSTSNYHEYNVRLLQTLLSLEDDDLLKEYYQRWSISAKADQD